MSNHSVIFLNDLIERSHRFSCNFLFRGQTCAGSFDKLSMNSALKLEQRQSLRMSAGQTSSISKNFLLRYSEHFTVSVVTLNQIIYIYSVVKKPLYILSHIIFILSSIYVEYFLIYIPHLPKHHPLYQRR